MRKRPRHGHRHLCGGRPTVKNFLLRNWYKFQLYCARIDTSDAFETRNEKRYLQCVQRETNIRVKLLEVCKWR